MKIFFRLSLFLLFVFLQTGCATFSDQEEDNGTTLAPVEDKSSSQNPYAAIKQKLAEDSPARRLEQPTMSNRDANQPSLRFEEVSDEAELNTQESNKEQPRTSATHSLWIWPTNNPIIHEFNVTSVDRKGIDFSGKVGDSVRAVRAGKVVFSGAGLKGYGQLIIIKHDSNLLTAYAHNHSLLVKEGDLVDAGQVISEMGLNEETGTVMLHFEVRLNGKPVNPISYLPQRG